MKGVRFSVVRVPSYQDVGGGTAFFVSPAGRLVTCAHVAADAVDADGHISLDLPDMHGGSDSTRLLARWLRVPRAEALDLAVLELEGPLPSGVQMQALCDFELAVHSKVLSYGFTNAHQEFGDSAIGEILETVRNPATGSEMIVVRSDELTGGFSGAPIIDPASGCAVAVMAGTLNPDSRGKFARHAWCIPGAAFNEIAHLVDIQAHPLAAELQRFATERMPTMLDFRLDSALPKHLMPTMLQRKGLEGRNPEDETVSVEEILAVLSEATPKAVVVYGIAGSGKSTLLRSLLAPALVNRPRRHIPIYARAQMLSTGSGGMVARVASTLSATASLNFPTGELERHLAWLLASRTQHFVFLIDGLDEVQDVCTRTELAKDLGEFATTLSQQGHGLVITSKPCSELDLFCKCVANLEKFKMAPFADEDIATFLSQLVGGDAHELLARFRHSVGGGLIGHALIATLAASVGDIPDSIVDLYGKYFYQIITRLQSSGDARFMEEKAFEVLENSAILAHASLSVDALDESTAIKSMTDAYRRQRRFPIGTESIHARTALAQMLDSHLAFHKEGSLLCWNHQSFRDYFAGCYLARRVGEKAWVDACSSRDQPVWRMPILFTLLLASQGKPLDEESLLSLGVGGESIPADGDMDLITSLLLSGAAFEPSVEADSIDTLVFAGMSEIGDLNSCGRLFRIYDHPLRQLLRLRLARPDVDKKLMAIITDDSLDPLRRRALARMLFDAD